MNGTGDVHPTEQELERERVLLEMSERMAEREAAKLLSKTDVEVVHGVETRHRLSDDQVSTEPYQELKYTLHIGDLRPQDVIEILESEPHAVTTGHGTRLVADTEMDWESVEIADDYTHPDGYTPNIVAAKL